MISISTLKFKVLHPLKIYFINLEIHLIGAWHVFLIQQRRLENDIIKKILL